MEAATVQDLLSGYGSLLAVVGLVLREAWNSYKNNRLDRRDKDAQEKGWDRLEKLLTQAEAKAKVAEERADMFAKERNDMVLEVGALRGEVRALRTQVEVLTSALARRGLTDVDHD